MIAATSRTLSSRTGRDQPAASTTSSSPAATAAAVAVAVSAAWRCSRSGTRTATRIADTSSAMPATQNTTVGWPVTAASTPPIAGPSMKPPVCAAPYRPNASPWRSGGLASTR